MTEKVKVKSECLNDRDYFSYAFIRLYCVDRKKIKKKARVCYQNLDQIKHDIRLCSEGMTTLVLLNSNHPFKQNLI